MKVAIFTDTYLPEVNGVAKTLGQLAGYLNSKGIAYRIFAPEYGETQAENNTIRFFSLPFLIYPQSRVAFPDGMRIAKELENFDPDIIHVITQFGIGLAGLKYAKENNIPAVSTYTTNFSQYLYYFRLKALENISWKYLKWFHNQSVRSFCPSYKTISLLQEKGINNPDLWSRGINTNAFSPRYRDVEFREKLGINDKTVILYAGRISPEKDLDILLHTAEKLNEKYISQIHFLLAGDGPYLEEIRKRSIPNLTALGFIKGQELSRAYASSDIFMFPSTSETFGNVILEAMASGLPVIASPEGGIADNLIDGYNGISCKKRNIEDYYEAASRLIEDRKLAKRLAANGIEHTADRKWEKIFDKLINDYYEIVSENSINIDEIA